MNDPVYLFGWPRALAVCIALSTLFPPVQLINENGASRFRGFMFLFDSTSFDIHIGLLLVEWAAFVMIFWLSARSKS